MGTVTAPPLALPLQLRLLIAFSVCVCRVCVCVCVCRRVHVRPDRAALFGLFMFAIASLTLCIFNICVYISFTYTHLFSSYVCCRLYRSRKRWQLPFHIIRLVYCGTGPDTHTHFHSLIWIFSIPLLFIHGWYIVATLSFTHQVEENEREREREWTCNLTHFVRPHLRAPTGILAFSQKYSLFSHANFKVLLFLSLLLYAHWKQKRVSPRNHWVFRIVDDVEW